MPRLSVTLFGGFGARSRAGPVAVPLRKAQALLAYLAMRPGHAHARGKLAALLWGDAGEEEARNSLRQALFALRRALAAAKAPALVGEADSVALDPAAVSVDVVTFERLLKEETTAGLEAAVAVYAGDLLEGFDVPGSPFDEWLVAERQRLRERVVEALQRLVRDHAGTGGDDRAVRAAQRLLAIDPLQEAAHRALMRLHARQGRPAVALRQYQACVDVLQRELSVEPEAETKALYRQLLGQRATGGAAERPARPAGPPMVGRDADLARLRRALEQAIRGRGTVVMVQGEAGIGKTRLADELAALATERGCRVLHGRAFASERILPFGVWMNAVRAGQITARADVVAGLDPAWRRQLARLFPEIDPAGAAGPEDTRQLFEAMDRLVARLAGEESLLVVLEDVHWADDTSLRLLAFVGRRVASRPVLIVATARAEEVADAPVLGEMLAELGKDHGVAIARLEALSRDDTLALARSLAPAGLAGWTAGRAAEHAWTLSEGNPFVVTEVIRDLREAGPTAAGSPRGLPEGVRELVTGRLARLGPDARELTAVAAVMGRDIEFEVLRRASALGERAAAAAVEDLVRRRILHEVGGRFDFTHERIREVAHAGLVTPRRRLLHGAVARALEEVHADRLEPHHGALGRHYREGEIWDRAVAHLRLAGRQAAARGAYRESVALLGQALDALGHLPESRQALEDAVDLRFDLRNALQPLSEFSEVIERLRQAEALANQLGDRRRLGWAISNLSTVVFHLGDWRSALDAGRRALDIGAAVGDTDLVVSSRFRLGMASYSPGDYRGAVRHLEDCVNRLGADVPRRIAGMTGMPAVLARHWLTWCHAELGEFDAGIARGQEAIAIATAAEHPYSVGAACHGLGYLHLRRGDTAQAIPLLERSLAACHAADGSLPWLWAASALGAAYAREGRHAEALGLLEDAIRQAEDRRRWEGHAQRLAWLAEAQLLAGRLDDARTIAARALDVAREHGERGHEAWALRTQGDIHMAAGAANEAEAAYRAASETAEALGMRPLLALCRAALGRLERCRGDAG